MLLSRPHLYDQKSIHRFIEDIHKFVNGRKISFGQQVDSGDQNIEGRMVETVDTGLANTEFSFIHNLGRIPLFYDVKYTDKATSIYDSGTPWTTTRAFFKSSTANVRIRLFIH